MTIESLPVNAVTRPAGVESRPTTIDYLVLTTGGRPANVVSLPTNIASATVTLESRPTGIDCRVLTIGGRPVNAVSLQVSLELSKTAIFQRKTRNFGRAYLATSRPRRFDLTTKYTDHTKLFSAVGAESL